MKYANNCIRYSDKLVYFSVLTSWWCFCWNGSHQHNSATKDTEDDYLFKIFIKFILLCSKTPVCLNQCLLFSFIILILFYSESLLFRPFFPLASFSESLTREDKTTRLPESPLKKAILINILSDSTKQSHVFLKKKCFDGNHAVPFSLKFYSLRICLL